jgi:hypothetical protein
VLTQTQHFAIVGKRAPVYAIDVCHEWIYSPYRFRIFLGGHRRGVCRLSLGLQSIGQQFSHVAVLRKGHTSTPGGSSPSPKMYGMYRIITFQIGHFSEPMTQGCREVMMGIRWRSLQRLDDGRAFEHATQDYVSYFGNLAGNFP